MAVPHGTQPRPQSSNSGAYGFFLPLFISVVETVPVAGIVVDVPLVAVIPVLVEPVVAVVSVAVIVPVVPVIDVSVALVAVLPVAMVSVAVVIDVSVAAVSVFVFCSRLQLIAKRPTTSTARIVSTKDFFMCVTVSL